MIRTVDVALSQVGVQEASGKNDGIPAERYMRGDHLAWCAGFCVWANANSDDPKIAHTDAEFYRFRLVQHLEDEMRERGWLLPADSTPAENDIIFFQHRGESDPGKGRHVGIVTGVEDGHVHTVEGNSGDRVATRSYSIADTYITGYARFPQS